ncbi:MAG: hypothetical protein KL840_07085 [Aquamicrobium sp.]|nr:hypothetical protein [Aquamicrobium sp.]
MPQSLALSDLVAPYFLKGQNLNAFHAAFSVLRVVEHETASDAFGISIRGRAEFQGRLSIPGPNGALFQFRNDETDPPFDPAQRDPVFDLSETSIGFELHVPRTASTIIAAGAAQLAGDANFAAARAVLADWDPIPLDAPPSDFPASAFTLDLIVNAPTFRPGGLRPARMTDDGLLVPDTNFSEVVLNLPKLRFRLAHDQGDGRLRFLLLSSGVESLDDPTDIATSEFISMVPPYAFVNGTDIGIGFRGGTLDLSTESTPPDVLERIGVGDDWQGIYLPELRVFVSGGRNGFAYQFGVRDFLFGFGPNGGISGDFEGRIFNQGSGDLTVGARFFDTSGRSFGLLERDGATASAVVPPITRMVVDVEGGRTPYAVSVSVDGAAPATGRIFEIDLSANATATIAIAVSDATSGAPDSAALTIAVRRGDPRTIVVTPGTAAEPAKPATIAVAAGANPRIVIKEQNDRFVTLTTEPLERDVRWSLDGGAETTPRPNFTVEVVAGASHQIRASIPGMTVQAMPVYFYFDLPPKPGAGAAEPQILASVLPESNDQVWTSLARGRSPGSGRETGGHRPLTGGNHPAIFEAIDPAVTQIQIVGHASFEDDESKLEHNYQLARRRAIAVRELIHHHYPGRFLPSIDPEPLVKESYVALPAWKAAWMTHKSPSDRDWWKAEIKFNPDPSRPPRASDATLTRDPSGGGTPPVISVIDPPVPNPPQRPDWFRSAGVKLRVIESRFVAIQIDGEIDVQTAAEEKLRNTGQVQGQPAERVRTLQRGVPLAPDNPGDGITAFRFLLQENEMTGETVVSFSIGADPSDTDGLLAVGWLPGEARTQSFWRDLLGSYISFWPLLAKAADRDVGSPVDAVITGAELALPPLIAALPWFTVERVIVHGAEYLARWHVAGSEGNVFFDLEACWSASLPSENDWLVRIDPAAPLSVRYKAIGVRLSDFDDDGAPIAPRYEFRPVFDSSRGYTIGLQNSGGLMLRPPFDRIFKILGARLSRINPMTFEVEIGMGVDFGVVSFDRLGIRAYLDQPRPPEITSIGARVDIPGALVGDGYLSISKTKIGGQIDLTVRAIGLRVAGALEIADISEAEGGPATGLFVGLDLLLPVGIPLGSTGLGIFGFRGLFGMHYARTPIGADKSVPSIEWLKAAKGRPNLLKGENGVILWEPRIDRWSFGVGTIIGTMEGGVLLNLDGTLLLELPGPNILIALNARFLTPPPAMEEAGGVGGVLAVLEITPQHIAIGIYATYEIEKLIEIKIPAEAFFSTGNLRKWHFYLGSRPDIPGPGPAVVRVLGIVDGTGYLMVRGEGLPAYKALPAITGFGIGIGAGASFIWGDTDIGLYLKVGGGFDAVVGFDPMLIAGTISVYGELRLFIVSVGADAHLTVTVREQDGPLPVAVRVDGKACGHVDFFFFEISECVSISFGTPGIEPNVPGLIGKVALKSRSPALTQGTGVDRPIDGSLGDAHESVGVPAADAPLPVVPIDSIPVITMLAPPVIEGAAFLGTTLAPPPNLDMTDNGFVDRGGERYRYGLQVLELERIAPDGSVIDPPVLGIGTPTRWWTQQGATGDPSAAQLALLTWDLDPAPKAIETSDKRTETIRDRWQTVCDDAAPPAAVLWTFRFEPLGPSTSGWDLAGIAWPDPDGTRRSGTADARLFVHEKWRSGIAWVDAARGIVPAMVVGGAVPCIRRTRPLRDLAEIVRVGGRGPVMREEGAGGRDGFSLAPDDTVLAALVGSDEVKPFRVPETLHAKALADMTARPQRDQFAAIAALGRGEEVSRADILGAFSPVGTLVAGEKRACEARVLQSPQLDDGTLVRFAGPLKEKLVKEALEEAGIVHGPLDDTLVLETAGFDRLRLLLFLTPIDEAATIVIRVLDEQGNELESRPVTFDDLVPPRDLPEEWTRTDMPWAAGITDVFAFLEAEKRLGRYRAALVELGPHEKAARVEIGVKRSDPQLRPFLLPYYLAAIELLRLSERLRFDHDTTTIDREREIVTESLGPASTDNAFLFPSSLYRCRLGWAGTRKSSGKTRQGEQSFWFRTDAEAPARLDSFVLMTSPMEGETHYFGGEPPRLVFATADIDRLYGAYGKELKVRLQAASGRHPPGQDGSAGQLDISAATLAGAGALVLSPFEDALVGVLDGQCIPIDGGRTRQTVVVIPIPLEPFTDYIMDVVAVPVGQHATHETPFIYRRHFSTGGHATMTDFGVSLGGLTVGHRAVQAGMTMTHLAPFAGRAPMGQELDEAFARAGLDVDGAPRTPKVTVLWEPAPGGSRPTAILVDAGEPLSRARLYPESVPDPDGLPGTRRWKLVEKEWLGFQPAAASAGLIEGEPVIAPGGQRALILLRPGALGSRIQLELVRRPFSEPYLAVAEERRTVVDLQLSQPPWEE